MDSIRSPILASPATIVEPEPEPKLDLPERQEPNNYLKVIKLKRREDPELHRESAESAEEEAKVAQP